METDRWQHQYVEAGYDEDDALDFIVRTGPDGRKTTHWEQSSPVNGYEDDQDPLVAYLNHLGAQGWFLAAVDAHHHGLGGSVRRHWLRRRES